MRDKLTYLVTRGIRNPEKIPPFVLGRLFRNSRWGPDWRERNGHIVFERNGFASGSPTRPELCARIYHEMKELEQALGEARYDRSLDIGCGYGRLSGWISEYATRNAAIEPNVRAVKTAHRLYGSVDFHAAVANRMPFADDAFDLVVTWMVLTHVPPDAIGASIDEIKRVTDPSGTILVCERTDGKRWQASWPRGREEYDERFDPFRIQRVVDRGDEPWVEHAEKIDLLVLEQ